MQSQPAGSSGVPAAVGPYSLAVRAGNLVFCSGQIPLNPTTGQLVAGDIREQTERVLDNLKAVLAMHNLALNHVVKTTVFMTNLADFAAMNEVYAKFFVDHPPARSTVQVAALPRGAQIEIEATAAY